MKIASSLVVFAVTIFSAACSGAGAEDNVSSSEEALTSKTTYFSKTSATSAVISLTNCQIPGQPLSSTGSEAQLWTLKPSAGAAANLATAVSANQATISFGLKFSGSRASSAYGHAVYTYQVYHSTAAGVRTAIASGGSTLESVGTTKLFEDIDTFTVPVPSTVAYKSGDSFVVEYQAALDGSCVAEMGSQFSGLFAFSANPSMSYSY